MAEESPFKVGKRDDGAAFIHFHNGIYMTFTFEQLAEVVSAASELLALEGFYDLDEEAGEPLPKVDVQVVLGRDYLSVTTTDDYTGDVATADIDKDEVADLIDRLERAEIAQWGDPLDEALGHAEVIQEMGVADMPAQLVPEFVEDFTEDVVAPLHESRDRRVKHGALKEATAKDFEKKGRPN